MEIRVIEIREAQVEVKDAKTYDEAERMAIKSIENGETVMQHVGYTSFIK